MATIELQNIWKSYPGHEGAALADFSLRIAKGEIVALLGPSGCGKTTALRLMAGFEAPDRGAILFDGRDMAGIPPEKRHIGMVFQDYALFPHLDVSRNIGFGLKRSEATARIVARLIDFAGLQGHEHKRPDQLSGGQQGRVALARALARDPVVVLLDEPFGALDADLRGKMQQDVSAMIRKSGSTAVFVTHDHKEAMTLSDRIAVMKEGRVEQVGAPREIYQQPETRFVATFLGGSNLLAGRMAADGHSIETPFGLVPCHHTHGRAPGERVMFCIRSCGFERDSEGPLRGRIVQRVFTGENTDARLSVPLPDGSCQELSVHLHPEDDVEEGAEVRFRILPYFVAVVVDRQRGKSGCEKIPGVGVRPAFPMT